MGIYKYDGNSYDIYEKTGYINVLKDKQHTINSNGGVYRFSTNKNVGYCDKALFTVTINNGLKHNIDDYNNKPLIIMKLTEIYVDSDNKKHVVHKLVNLGAYVTQKNTSLTIKHLSNMLCTKLNETQGEIINNSNFSISISDVDMYKSMVYANSQIEGDNQKIPINTNGSSSGTGGSGSGSSIGVGSGDGWNTSITEIGVPDSTRVIDDSDINPNEIGGELYYRVFQNNKDYIDKCGDINIWNTSSRWYIDIKDSISRPWGYDYVRHSFTAFDDKGNYLGNSDEDYISLINYSEYIILSYQMAKTLDDITWNSSNVCIIYMNNLGRKYKGNAKKYHFGFNLNIEDNGEFPLAEHKNSLENNKYNNYAGVLTIQLIGQPTEDYPDVMVTHFYISPHPFCGVTTYNNKVTTQYSKPCIVSGHLVWYMEEIRNGSTVSGENAVVSGMTDTEFISNYDIANGNVDSWFSSIGTVKAKQFMEFGKALEDLYPNGNL